MANPATCGKLVDGHPCMRVPGHPGFHIPGTPNAEAITPVGGWFDGKPLDPFLDRRMRYYRHLPIIAGICLAGLTVIQLYVDILVLIHWT